MTEMLNPHSDSMVPFCLTWEVMRELLLAVGKAPCLVDGAAQLPLKGVVESRKPRNRRLQRKDIFRSFLKSLNSLLAKRRL